MMISIFLRRALTDIRQYLPTQMMTTMVVSLSLLILTFFCLFSVNLQHFVERFGNELGIVVFLKQGLPQERIPLLYQRIAGLDGVETVKYVSPEEAFKRLRSYLKDEQEVLEGVDPRFLPPSFEIQINRAVFNLTRIKQVAGVIEQWPEVSKVQYGQEWIDRLEALSRIVEKAVVIGGLLLMLTAAFVVANTIKLTVYARQEELEILRLVGATNSFIQGPFLIEAFLQGLAGSAVALSIVFGTYVYLERMLGLSALFKNFELSFLPWQYVVAIISSSVILCVMGTALAMRRFLRL